MIGESRRELLPKSSGPAAIIRIFGVTKEGKLLLLLMFWVLWFFRNELIPNVFKICLLFKCV